MRKGLKTYRGGRSVSCRFQVDWSQVSQFGCFANTFGGLPASFVPTNQPQGSTWLPQATTPKAAPMLSRPKTSSAEVPQSIPATQAFKSEKFGSFDDVLSADLPESELLWKIKAYVSDIVKWLGRCFFFFFAWGIGRPDAMFFLCHTCITVYVSLICTYIFFFLAGESCTAWPHL